MTPAEEASSNVPKGSAGEVEAGSAAKGLLMDLEEQVRLLLQKWGREGKP